MWFAWNKTLTVISASLRSEDEHCTCCRVPPYELSLIRNLPFIHSDIILISITSEYPRDKIEHRRETPLQYGLAHSKKALRVYGRIESEPLPSHPVLEPYLIERKHTGDLYARAPHAGWWNQVKITTSFSKTQTSLWLLLIKHNSAIS